MPGDDTAQTWTPRELDALRAELGDVYRDRTCLVTGADGFMGSHLTEALVALGANVVAFVRATSSGALNNIGHLRSDLRVVFADLTDKTSIDYLVRDHLVTARDRPYVFHLGAQAHVGESWHRPYETVMANTVGTLNLLQSIVDHGVELEKFDTAGTSEEYGNVHESVAHQHDFDELGGLILHERSPINPKSIYATAKVAADFLTMNYHDAYGVPGVVTRMFNNYGPRQNPRYVTGTIITQALTRPEIELGALEPLRDFCFTTDGVRGHLTVAAKGIPGDLYVYGQGENISMRDWSATDPPARPASTASGRPTATWSTDERRLRPGATDVMALRVGYEKLHEETGWEPKVSWEEGVLRTIRWYAENRDRWLGRVDWLTRHGQPPARTVSRILVTGGGGFVGSHLVERLEAAGHDVVAPRRVEFDLTHWDDAERLFEDAQPGARLPPRRRGRRHRREPRQPGPLLVREPDDGRARAGAVARARRGEGDRRGHRLRLPEVHADPVPRGRPLERLSGGDERSRTASRRRRVLVGAQAYREQYGLDAIFLLPANMYGPRDNFDLETSHVIPALIRKMVEAEGEVVLWGDGSPTREFLYVDDCVEGLLLAAERYDGPEPVNLGTGVETTIRELAETIAELTGFEGEMVWDTTMPNGQPRRQLDASRAAELFGFHARTSLRDGLLRTIDWYRQHALIHS